MVTVNGEKMSKSLGNFTTIRELLDRPVDPIAVRLFVITAHYRQPLDFTELAIAGAQNSWDTLKEGLLFGYHYDRKLGWVTNGGNFVEGSSRPPLLDFKAAERFQTAMDDDFNSSVGLTVLFELTKELRREGNLFLHQGKTDTPLRRIKQQWHTLVHLAQVLGLEAKPEDETAASSNDLGDAEIAALIQQRQDARQTRNFAAADRIRNELQAVGITLIDQPDGKTLWHC